MSWRWASSAKFCSDLLVCNMKIGESSRCFEAVNNCQRMDLKLEKNALPSADLGHFEYCAPQAHMAGVVIGAPRGLTD